MLIRFATIELVSDPLLMQEKCGGKVVERKCDGSEGEETRRKEKGEASKRARVDEGEE